jgi:hypothetical protein
LDGIFRGGQPQKVEPVSYVIENGRRIERPAPAPLKKPEPAAPIQPLSSPTPSKPIVTAPAPAAPAPAAVPVAAPVDTAATEKKRGPWFGFGKRDEAAEPSNPVLTPIPAAAPLLGATPVAAEPAPSAKPVSKPKPAPAPAPIASKPVEKTAPSPVAAPTLSGDTPDFANVKEEKGEKFGWIPFLGRKKDEEVPAVPAAMQAATPVPSDTVAAVPAPAAKGKGVSPHTAERPDVAANAALGAHLAGRGGRWTGEAQNVPLFVGHDLENMGCLFQLRPRLVVQVNGGDFQHGINALNHSFTVGPANASLRCFAVLLGRSGQRGQGFGSDVTGRFAAEALDGGGGGFRLENHKPSGPFGILGGGAHGVSAVWN